MKWNESGFRPPLCTYRLNWARRTSWGWWDDWDDTVLQTQDSKFEPWRSEAEHATSRSRRLPTILTFTRGWGRNIQYSLLFQKDTSHFGGKVKHEPCAWYTFDFSVFITQPNHKPANTRHWANTGLILAHHLLGNRLKGLGESRDLPCFTVLRYETVKLLFLFFVIFNMLLKE